MCKHGGCSETVQKDGILRCGDLDHHVIGIYEMWAQVEGTGTTSTNAIWVHLWPDFITFVGALNACANTEALEEGRCVHEWIVESRWDSDVFVGNKLVDMYAKCGNMEDVWRVFNKMSSPNVMRRTTMILGHLKIGQAQKALESFWQMQHLRMFNQTLYFHGGAECMCLRCTWTG